MVRHLSPSKTFLILSFFLLCSYPVILISQSCASPPQNLMNGNFDLPSSAIPANSNNAINTMMPGWLVSHGSPTTPSLPNRSMWMWSYSGIGEGVFNCYDFQPGEQYRICFDLQTNSWGDSAQVNVMAATGLNASGSTAIPSPSTSTQIWQDLASNYNSQNWTRITTVFTPSNNYSEIWFYPFWSRTNGANQVEMTIDNVSIEHIGTGNYSAGPINTTICPTQSVQLNASGGHAYSWFPSTGLSCANCPNPIASPLTTTTYTVSIMDYRECEPVAIPRQVTVTVDKCSLNSDFVYTTQICNDVQFNQTSTPGPCTQITGWHWDFGDNTFSSLANPLHTYANPGSYTVCLTTFGNDGFLNCQTQKCYTVTAGYCEVNADYSYSLTDGCLDIQFNDLSTPGPCTQINGWYWDFGYPGGISTQQNPIHTFPGSGTYNVCLYTFGDNGYVSCVDDFCMLVDVGEPCNIKTNLAYYQPGTNCMDLQFFDMSVAGRCTYLNGWYWDFGDGTSSNQPNPLHTFPGAGTYTVCLTSFGHDGNISCWDDTCYNVTIDATCSIEANFVYNSAGCVYGHFYNTSTWSSCTQNIQYHWDFGDGTFSSQQDPNHTFPGPGTYIVCLTVNGDNGFVSCIDDTCFAVEIGDPCSIEAYPTQTINQCSVQFKDSSIYSPCMYNIQWLWDFGDGTQSNVQNPFHTYTNPGTYQVCLNITGDDGFVSCIKDTCYTIIINCTDPCLCNTQADFNYMMDRCDIQFYDNSTVDPSCTITGWQWDFGYPGGISNQQNPFHTFPGSGSYNVCLTVFSNNGQMSCTNTYCQIINMDCVVPVRPNSTSASNKLSPDIRVYPNPTSGDVFIEFTNEAGQQVSVDVLSSAGQIITKLPIRNQEEQYYSLKWSPEEQGLTAGIYYLRIKVGDTITHRKVIYYN